MEALLLEHKRLIYVVIRRQYPGQCEYVDLIQEGWIGLWQAILHFDAGRGCTFSTYAGRAIRNRIWYAVGQGWKMHGWLEAEREGDSLARLVDVWQQAQVRQAVVEELACLPERLRGGVVQAYGLDGQAPLHLSEIGKQLGVSRERVRQMRNEGLGLMRLPALSIRLRSLCEQDSRQAYRQVRQVKDGSLRRYRGRR